MIKEEYLEGGKMNLVKESIGVPNPLCKKKEQIRNWNAEIEKGTMARKNEIITRITPEYFRLLQKLDSKDGQKLCELNQELICLFYPAILNCLNSKEELDKE
jgi:hypothetical protein